MTTALQTSRILVVDDSPIDRLFATRLLEQRRGWIVTGVEDGETAWDLIAQDPPDLVVTDLQMPVMDGLELVRRVKATLPNLPIILITAQGSETVAAESLREGATSYTPKAFLQKDLVRTCEYVLDLANHIAHPVTNRTSFEQRFVLNNDCGLVIPLIEHLQNFMPTWTENFRLQLGMAIGEAMVNAMHHGNLELCSSMREEEHGCCYHQLAKSRQHELPFCDRRISIQAEFNQYQLKISVSDEGAGFDPQAIADPRDATNVTKLHGRGLLLIRSFMDEVVYNDRGNTITMIKRRDTEQSAC